MQDRDWNERGHEEVPRGKYYALLLRTTQVFAVAGGILFVILMGMSLISILGLKLGFGGVTGDIELMQVGTAVAVTAFLPYCTLQGEHLKVDFFTENFPAGSKQFLDRFADLCLTGMMGLLSWLTLQGALAKYENEEVTSLVSLPIWIPFSLLIPSLVLMTLCALWRLCSLQLYR